MADVTVKYKDNIIAEMSAESTKTLNTSGQYCEGDISISYKPPTASGTDEVRHRIYEITLSKASGWVLLTTLDADVLEHINDSDLIVTLKNLSDFSYVNYAGNTYITGNIPIGYSSTYPVYGATNRTNKETTTSFTAMFYPANNTGTDVSLGGNGMFRLDGDKYYLRPGDGYVYPGTYRLTFPW